MGTALSEAKELADARRKLGIDPSQYLQKKHGPANPLIVDFQPLEL